MLSRLGARGCRAREDQVIIGDAERVFDPDFDFDSDLDENANEPCHTWRVTFSQPA